MKEIDKQVTTVVNHHNLKGIYNIVSEVIKKSSGVTNHNLKGIYNFYGGFSESTVLPNKSLKVYTIIDTLSF